MKPILYNSTETAYTTNGIGKLSDAISCYAKTALNGQVEVTLTYPEKGLHAADLLLDNIILVKSDPDMDPQPYRIYHRNKPLNGKFTVNARHIVYDLSGVVVKPFAAGGASAALAGFPANAVNACPFTFSTDITSSAVFVATVPKSVWSLMGASDGAILSTFGGEWLFDRYHARLLSRRGADRGVTIRYGKNLRTLEQDENNANCYTGVMPYWVDKKTKAVTLHPDNIIHAQGTFSRTKIYPLDLSAEFDTVPTAQQLADAARAYMEKTKLCEPTVSLKVEFVLLKDTDEHKDKAVLEKVLLGDTVSVYMSDMNVDVSARVIETEYDCLQERYTYVYLGSMKDNLADTIIKQGYQVAALPGQTQAAMEAMLKSGSITSTDGSTAFNLDENRFYSIGTDPDTHIPVMAELGESQIAFYWGMDDSGKLVRVARLFAKSGGVQMSASGEMRLYGASGTWLGSEDNFTYISGTNTTLLGHIVRIYSLYGDLVIGNGETDIVLQGKRTSWKENSDGTFTLIGK